MHFYALCTFPTSEALRHARAQCNNNIPSHAPSKSTRRTVSVYQLSRRSLKVSRSKNAYATYHQMQCTIELRTLNSNNVPNLVSPVQTFLEPEDPSRIFFSVLARSLFSLHPTKMATRKAYRLGQYTYDLQVRDWWCTSFCM